ncbi:hypothetical protein [Amycolatopsis sp. CA-128772]|uniref:hypothetical protein n=1 Tax=Amycolatopsis sp. CA-128772 TaxID=2073159 RepID=UPI000CD0A92D|nr:hypothetical protein [Amycolatopsis sp. CA-128772]
MNGFEADPVLLRAAGHRFGALAAESAACPELRYAAKAEHAGDVLLGRALDDLQDASARAAALLLGEARELGARLERAARLYAGRDADALGAVGLIGAPEPSGPAGLG